MPATQACLCELVDEVRVSLARPTSSSHKHACLACNARGARPLGAPQPFSAARLLCAPMHTHAHPSSHYRHTPGDTYHVEMLNNYSRNWPSIKWVDGKPQLRPGFLEPFDDPKVRESENLLVGVGVGWFQVSILAAVLRRGGGPLMQQSLQRSCCTHAVGVVIASSQQAEGSTPRTQGCQQPAPVSATRAKGHFELFNCVRVSPHKTPAAAPVAISDGAPRPGTPPGLGLG